MDKLAALGIRRAVREDLPEIARINASGFQGNRADINEGLNWVTDEFNSGDHYHYFLIEKEGRVAGYIGWEIHGGYLRANPCVELEQVAVDPEFKGNGLADLLIGATMTEMRRWVQGRNNRIESYIRFIVWGYYDNERAQEVYARHFPHVSGLRHQFGPRAEIMRYADHAWAHRASEGMD